MTAPQTHLRHYRTTHTLTARASCGVVAWNWTDDPQAVTCPRCIAQIELQPA